MSGADERPRVNMRCRCGSRTWRRRFIEYGWVYANSEVRNSGILEHVDMEFPSEYDWHCTQCEALPSDEIYDFLERYGV